MNLGNAWLSLPACLLLCGLAVEVGFADYDAGLEAYLQGDFDLARQEWMRAADEPEEGTPTPVRAETYYALAMLYWQGQGVPRDYHQSKIWLDRAARLQHAGAMGKLGYLYTDGLTVPRDHDEAFRWFSSAARLGDVDAQYNLGIFYLNGWGTEADRTLAKQYLAAASANGDPSAEKALQQLMAEDDRMAATRAAEIITTPGLQSEAPEIAMNEEWISLQPPDEYTIQVIALSTRERVEELIEAHHDLAPWAIYSVQTDTRPLYVLVQGRYADVESARRARATIPASIQQRDKLWIRRFGKVQELINSEQGG